MVTGHWRDFYQGLKNLWEKTGMFGVIKIKSDIRRTVSV